MAAQIQSTTLPDVINCGYDDFKIDEDKKIASARCKTCRAKNQSKSGNKTLVHRIPSGTARVVNSNVNN